MDLIIDSLKVQSLQEYISLFDGKKMKDYFYRGENKLYPARVSTLLRHSETLLLHKKSYEKLVRDYYEEIAVNIGEFERNNFLAFSQHHGLSTNLIDFTTSPLVALYFACEKKETDYHEGDKGYVYLIHNSRTVDASDLINELIGPIKSLNIVEQIFIMRNKVLLESIEKIYDVFFRENDINPYLEEIRELYNLIVKSSNISSCKFLDKRLNEIEFEDVFQFAMERSGIFLKYFLRPNYNDEEDDFSMLSTLIEYLTKLHLFLCDMISDQVHKGTDFSFPMMPYFFYKTPYKFDRIRNQEGIFLCQQYLLCSYESYGDKIIIQDIKPDAIIEAMFTG